VDALQCCIGHVPAHVGGWAAVAIGSTMVMRPCPGFTREDQCQKCEAEGQIEFHSTLLMRLLAGAGLDTEWVYIQPLLTPAGGRS
jgi:hypothetical protein